MTRKRGRPAIDWNQLYTDWLNSGLSKNDFLRANGFEYKSGSVSRNTRHWLGNLAKLTARLHSQYIASLRNGKNITHFGCFPEF